MNQSLEIYPNRLNMFGNPVRCMECDSLYHVIVYCPFYKSRINSRDNHKFLNEIINYKFMRNEKDIKI